MKAYCRKCRALQTIKEPKRITTKNGKKETRGTCPICGSKITKKVGPTYWRRSYTKAKKFASDTMDAPILRGAKRWDPDDIRWLQWWIWRALSFCAVASVVVWVIHTMKIPGPEGKLVDLKVGLLGLTVEAMQSLEVFVSVFGLAYAIVVGLLIIEAHGRFHRLSSAFRSELNAISDIHDCLGYFANCEQTKKKIRIQLLRYVGRLKKYEWPLMEYARAGSRVVMQYLMHPERKSDKMWGHYGIQEYKRIDPFRVRGMDEIVEAVRELKPTAEDGRCAWQTIIDKICDLTTQRMDRLELAENGLKGYLKSFLIFMSVVIVGATLFLSQAALWLHLFIVGATVAGLVGLYMILIDVDRPFSGVWRINKKLLDAIMEKLAGENKELLKVIDEYKEG